MLWCAVARTLGAGYSSYAGCVLTPFATLAELDAVPVSRPCPEPFNKMIDTGARYGIQTITISSPTACQRIEDSAIVLMYAVTLGESVEKEVDALFMNKDITRGLALDSALAVATAGYTKQLVDMLDEAGADKGYKAAWIMNPGTGDWPAGQMANIAQAVHAEQIGVSLLPSGMLMPRKTVTGVIGLNFIGGGCSGSCSACAMAGHHPQVYAG